MTPLYGADGEIYAVSQGQLTVGGFVTQGVAKSITQGVPTSARIAAGGIIEREVEFELDQLERIRLALRNPDFTTAERIAGAINRRFDATIARVTDSHHGGAQRAAGVSRPRRGAAHRDRAARG